MNPWLTMWFRPRATIRNLIDTATEFNGWIFAVVFAAIGQSLGESWFNTDADTGSIGRILLTSAIHGFLYTFFYLAINCFLIHKFGQFMGGKASKEDVLLALGWSGVPIAWSLLIWVPLLFVPEARLFSENALNQPVSSEELIVLSILFLIHLGVFLWMMVLLCKCISELQNFSIWKAILSVLMASGVFVIPYYLLMALWR